MRIHALLELNLLNCTAGVTQQVESCGFLHNKRHMGVGGGQRVRVEEGDPLSFPIQGGAKIYVFEWEL